MNLRKCMSAAGARMRALVASGVAITACLGMPTGASAQIADTWANLDRLHVFMNVGRGQWEEREHGQVKFKFVETARGSNRVVLFDHGRGITVSLTDGKGEVSSGTNVLMTFRGGFFYKEWTYADRGGKFVQASGKTWHEFQNGKLAFKFVQSSRTLNTVELVDTSRDVTVSLSPSGAAVTQYGSPVGAISGGWTR